MMRNAAVIVVLAGAADAAKVFLGGKNGMRPDKVAQTLAKVEDEWNLQVASFVECNTSAATAEEASECTLAPHAFQHSCSKVVTAMVAGSDGSKADVAEYMTTVCGEDAQVSEGWRKARCQALSNAIAQGMSDDAYNNRASFDSNKLCGKFWTKFMTEENTRVQKEEAVKAAEEKKEEEEERVAAEKKADEEAAAEEKTRAEEAVAEEAKKKEEEVQAAKELKEAEAKALAEKNAKAEAAAASAEKMLEAAKVAEAKEEATPEAAKPEAAPAKPEAAPAQPEAAPAQPEAAPAQPAVLAVAKTVNVTAPAANATAAANAMAVKKTA